MATSAVTNTFVVDTTIDPDTVNENFGNLVDFDNTKVVHRDGSKAMTGAFDAGNQKLVNVQAGTADTDAANIANVDAVLPVGMMTAFGGTSAPSGWLLCQGQSVSQVTYAALYAVIGDTFGTGDGAGEFNLPDMQDKYPIGKSATVAVGDVVGSNDAVAVNHGHADTFSASSSGGSHSHTDTFSASSSQGTHAHTETGGSSINPPGGWLYQAASDGVNFNVAVGSALSGAGSTIKYTQPSTAAASAGAITTSISGSVSTSASHSHTISVSGSVTDLTGETGVDANRPESVGVNWIIRTNV